MLRELQATISRELLSGEPAALALLAGPPEEAMRRLEVHRRNVMASLVACLAANFPATSRAAGEVLFGSLACRFIEVTPPERPQLLDYGRGFGDFLAAALEGLQPWLADLARLDWAWLEAFAAADCEPLDPARLRDIPHARYPGLRFALHPATRLVASAWPILTLWQANLPGGPAAVADVWAGQRVLVRRPRLDVTCVALTAGDQALVTALAGGMTLAEAAQTALDAEPSFDLQAALAAHLTHGTFSAVTLATG